VAVAAHGKVQLEGRDTELERTDEALEGVLRCEAAGASVPLDIERPCIDRRRAEDREQDAE